MPDARRILVVEDERDLAELLRYNLNMSGYSAEVASDGSAALEAIGRRVPDLIVLDVMMPQIDGIGVLEQVRRDPLTEAVPVLMLTAKSAEADQMRGFDAGADDYVTKPFSLKVLLARIEALLRRTDHRGVDRELQLGPVVVDEARHEIMVHGEPVKLTLTEFRLLCVLMKNPDRVQSRRSLISSAIGPGITITERTVDVHVAAIRRKLGRADRMLETIRGVGYRMTDRACSSE